MKDDPAIERVREARHRISAELDHDPKKLVDYYRKRAQEREERHPGKVKRNYNKDV